MPTYTYKREDGSIFEFDQRITEDAIKVCPTTGQKVKRIISGGAGLVFKGSGFYLTDYGKSGSSGGSDAKKSDSGGETKSKSTESKSSDTAKKTEKTSTSSAKDD
ncbi:MAG: FmdB family zinc ribbon protein [Rhodothermales bacterium]